MTEQKIAPLERIQLMALMGFLLFDFFSISLAHIFGFLGGGAWLWHTHRTGSWRSLKFPLALPIGIFFAASLLAVATSLDPLRSFSHLKRLFEMVVFFLTLNSLGGNPSRTFLSVVPGRFREWLAGRARFLGTLSFREAVFFWALFSASLAASLGLIQGLVRGISLDARISGTLSIYITFAGLMMQTGLLATAYLLYRKDRRGWVAVALGLILTALLVSLTRGSWFGFGVGFMVLLAIRKPVLLLIPPVAAVLLYLAAPQPIQSRISSLADSKDVTFQSRLDMWKLGWKVFQRYPVTGCGYYCLQMVAKDYPEPEHQKFFLRYKHIHNQALQIAIDMGLVGLAAWLFFWFSYFREAARRYRLFSPGSWQRGLTLGSIASTTAFLAAGIFECNFYDSEIVLFCYFAMALPWTFPEEAETAVRTPAPS